MTDYDDRIDWHFTCPQCHGKVVPSVAELIDVNEQGAELYDDTIGQVLFCRECKLRIIVDDRRNYKPPCQHVNMITEYLEAPKTIRFTSGSIWLITSRSHCADCGYRSFTKVQSYGQPFQMGETEDGKPVTFEQIVFE